MKILKNLFAKKLPSSYFYEEFWDWFKAEEKNFFKVAKSGQNIESGFFQKLDPMLDKVHAGFFYLTGMIDENTAELIITADGDLKNMAFVEDLISAAPPIEGWRFTAHKPELDIKDVSIEMDGVKFNSDTIAFKPHVDESYPDAIKLVLYHKDSAKADKQIIINGSYIYLDNCLGEIRSITAIDYVEVEGWPDNEEGLVPINKIKDYIIWREKEFVEKYEGVKYNTEHDSYASYEAQFEDGTPLIATINTDLLAWDAKASHPWICIFTIVYDGKENNGFPTQEDFEAMDKIELEITDVLKDYLGYLNVGRQTGGDRRDIYFSCKDFREPSRMMKQIEKKFGDQFKFELDIFKDKYWSIHERFTNPI